MARRTVNIILWCLLVVASSSLTAFIFTRDNVVESPKKPSVFADTVHQQLRQWNRNDYQ